MTNSKGTFSADGMITEVHFNGETYWVERRMDGQPSKTGEEVAYDLESEDEAVEIAKLKLTEL